MLTLNVRGRARGALPRTLRQRLRRQVGRAKEACGEAQGHLCLSLTDDDEVRALNLAYAGDDHATDVLSFSQREAPGTPFPDPSGELLGDIVISVETAARQAGAAGHGLIDELLHLSVHGLCHLLGLDHRRRAEARVMFGYEAELRAEARARGRVRPRPPPQRPPTKRSTRSSTSARAGARALPR